MTDKRYDAHKDKTEKKKYTREDIIQTLKELDAKSEKPIGRSALEKKGINQYWIRELIPEGLKELKQQLGLKVSTQERPLSNDELIEKLHKTVSDLEGIPSFTQLRRKTRITEKVFKQRFGKKGKPEVFSHYRNWLEKHEPNSKNIEFVDAYLEGQVKTKTSRSLVERKELTAKIKWQNLNYEPTNEQGVVFLFGMVSWALGFSIEYIGDDFPDCEAKRYTEGKRKRQEHVRIEFKHKSREYNYPVEDCDIIVCWEDNWGNDCPLEVIELRTEIERLRKSSEFSNRKKKIHI